MAPAKTGRESNSSTAVIRTAHGNIGIRSKNIPKARRFIMVVIKLIAPKREDTPAKCKEKMAKSTAAPLWETFPLNGGYTVHPVPAPFSTAELIRSRIRAGGKNQNLILLRRGKAISGDPSIKGTNQLPKHPIKIGITIKKIITKAWAVTTTL